MDGGIQEVQQQLEESIPERNSANFHQAIPGIGYS